MKVMFKIPIGPISTNSAYYKRNRAFNEKARNWRYTFLSHLQNSYNQKQIATIKNHFNPQKHALRCAFIWYQPHSILFTSSSQISLRSMDVDNCLKIPTDLLFDKKYNDKWLSLRKGAEAKLYNDMHSLCNLDINDKFIVDTRSIKLPSPDGQFHCSIIVEVVELSKLTSTAFTSNLKL